MTIAAILKHKGHAIITIEPTATVPEIAKKLAEHRIGAVLVMDKAEQVLGIARDRLRDQILRAGQIMAGSPQ